MTDVKENKPKNKSDETSPLKQDERFRVVGRRPIHETPLCGSRLSQKACLTIVRHLVPTTTHFGRLHPPCIAFCLLVPRIDLGYTAGRGSITLGMGWVCRFHSRKVERVCKKSIWYLRLLLKSPMRFLPLIEKVGIPKLVIVHIVQTFRRNRRAHPSGAGRVADSQEGE